MTTKQIEDYLKDQWELIVDLNISIKNMLRLKNNKYEYENQIKQHGFFQHYWYQLKFISVIQLSKLYNNNENEKRNFYKLCSKLESTPFDATFKNHLKMNSELYEGIATSRNDLEELIEKTRKKLSANADLIQKIIDIRNDIYAHKKPNPKVKNVTSEEIKTLVDLANSVYNDFEFNIFYKSTVFDKASSWDIDYVLFYMSELRRKDLIELENKKKSGT